MKDLGQLAFDQHLIHCTLILYYVVSVANSDIPHARISYCA